MKTLKFLSFVIAVLFYNLICNPAKAQTFQLVTTGTCDHAKLFCLEDQSISGYFTYHLTYHLGKDGKLEWLHWNLRDYYLVNDVTGEEYKDFDTGHSSINYGTWDFWNSLNLSNTGANITYDIPDGYFDLPEVEPDEGTFISAKFQVKSKTYGLIYLNSYAKVQLHRNAKGELTAELEDVVFDCNYY